MHSVIVGTAGHIDHGKSALVMALTGTDPDRLKEEKARGITIDLGFAHWQAGDLSFAFVDVPGHERFVKNMLAGVGGIDLVILVVAADESVMPQTREHFEICRLLRVPAGMVVLTKTDLVDEETIELARLEARELVAGSFLDGAPIVPVSSRTGAGLDEVRQALIGIGRDLPSRRASGATRLPIDRVFSVRGFGTVVTGTLVSGAVGPGDVVDLLPAARSVSVRGVQVHGSRLMRAHAGQRVAANLGGIDVSELARGDVLATPGAFEPTRRIDAVLELVHGARPLRHGSRVRFHQGTAEVLGRVALAEVLGAAGATTGLADQARRVAVEVPAGGRALVRLRLEGPAVVTRGDRYILRAYSPPVTIAGGVVLDPFPPRTGVRTPPGLRRFHALYGEGLAPDAAEARAVLTMVEERGAAGLTKGALVSRAGVDPGEAPGLVARLREQGRIVEVGSVVLAPPILDTLGRALIQMIGDYHRAEPLSDGLPREEARERLFARADPAVFDHLLRELSARGTILARDRLALASHHVSLSAGDARVREEVERSFEQAGLRPPDVGLVAAQLGHPPDVVDRIVKLLVRQKVLVRLDTLLFHELALRRLRQDLAALKSGAAPGQARIDVGMFKERYGVTRKHAIPLLEYLDRERVTRRIGDSRVML